MRVALLAVVMMVLVMGCDKLPFASQPAAPPPEPAKAPVYSPASDLARPEFEKALDLIHGFNWSDDQHVKAGQFVEQMKNSYPDSPYPLIAEAELELRMWQSQGGGAPEHIRALINKSIAKSREIADAYVTLAKLDLEQGRIASASDNANKAFKLAPDKPEVRFAMAQAAEKNKKYDQAEQHYLKYIELSGKPIRQSNIYYAMARMFDKMVPPEPAKADEAFQNSIRLDPQAPWKHYGYAAFLLESRGDYEGSLIYSQNAMKFMTHSTIQEEIALAAYAKWADGYANKWANYKPRDKQSAPPQKVTIADLRKIAQFTGVSVDNAFVELSRGPALGYAVRALIMAKAVPNIDVKTEGPCGCTALIKAADANNLDLAKFLIANRANVNGTNARGETALSRFILLKNWEAVKFVLDKGARVNVTDNDGYTPLQLVLDYASADLEGFKLLLARKADPTVRLSDGSTFLSRVVPGNSAELVQILVDHGANPNEPISVRQPSTLSLVGLAALMSKKDILAVLLKGGGDPWGVDEKFFRSMEKSKPEIYQLISDARAARPRPAANPAAVSAPAPGPEKN